jgi:transcriptional regulator with XRE-family HTH domain
MSEEPAPQPDPGAPATKNPTVAATGAAAGDEAAAASSATPSLAERIDRLFKTVRPPERPGREYTPGEVAAAISERATSDDGKISDTYIRYLRSGQRTNPTKRHLEALAAFFGVPVSYFLDDDAAGRIYSQLALLSAMRDERVQALALRAAGLSDRALAAITEMINHARVLEGLPNGDDAT